MSEEVCGVVLLKEAALKKFFEDCGRIVVAYSGGVDSTYLADVAFEVLGNDVHLLLADSPTLPRSERAEAKALARERGWNLAVVATTEFEDPAFVANDAQRCYYCKGLRFDTMKTYAAQHGIEAIAHGENADDARDTTRVGVRAAAERGILAPLQTVGLGKDEIRQLSRRRDLPTWNKPSLACLATRVPAGTPLDPAELARVEQAEEVLKTAGLPQYRARVHGDLCRIEVEPETFGRVLDADLRTQIVTGLRALGYRYVTLDLEGYGHKGSTTKDGST